MKPTPRPDARRRAYLKDRFKRFRLKEFRIDAPHFLRQIQREYASKKRSARRKLVWGELYDHIGKKWTISQFNRNLLQHELDKRKKWQMLHETITFEQKPTQNNIQHFIRTAQHTLRDARIYINASLKRDPTQQAGGTVRLIEKTLNKIKGLQKKLVGGKDVSITAETIQSVMYAQWLLLERQFQTEFASQLIEAERFTHEWLSRQR